MPATKNKNRTILVSGATGLQGGAVLRHLRDKGFPVRALTRNSDQPQARAITGHGVEVVRGDLNDQASLVRALDGMYGAYSVQMARQEDLEGEIQQGIRFADAAKRLDVSHFVYSSVASADQQTGIPHFDSKFRIEQHIRGTGMHYTIVRPVFFMENWLGMRQSIENGEVSSPLSPTTRLQMIAVDDIGEIVALAFQRTGKFRDRVFEIAGDDLSMEELALAFSRVLAREVRYVQTPWDEFEKKAGPEITRMYRWFEEQGYHVDISSVREEHPGLRSFGQWMNSYWHSAVRTA
jgi:uncharacterized protein YbjT (DUF2867 family)